MYIFILKINRFIKNINKNTYKCSDLEEKKSFSLIWLEIIYFHKIIVRTLRKNVTKIIFAFKYYDKDSLIISIQ